MVYHRSGYIIKIILSNAEITVYPFVICKRVNRYYNIGEAQAGALVRLAGTRLRGGRSNTTTVRSGESSANDGVKRKGR